ncbi:MAG TPA: hypothetical protein ENH59_03205 [Bacteroidetes bacterium]|nr:hypothetical protein [Bacteroidota bacterium]
MECKEVHNDLIFFIEGNIDDKRSAEIKEHLEACHECADFADKLRASLDVIEAEKKVSENNDFADRIMAELNSRERKQKTYSLRILRYAAAAAVIIFGVFTGINIARMSSGYGENGLAGMSEEMYYLNDLYQEPIEGFFLIKYEDNE